MLLILRDWYEAFLVKLILFLTISIGDSFKRPSMERINAFYESVRSIKTPVTLRWSKGDDIAAACGQLSTKSAKV